MGNILLTGFIGGLFRMSDDTCSEKGEGETWKHFTVLTRQYFIIELINKWDLLK